MTMQEKVDSLDESKVVFTESGFSGLQEAMDAIRVVTEETQYQLYDDEGSKVMRITIVDPVLNEVVGIENLTQSFKEMIEAKDRKHTINIHYRHNGKYHMIDISDDKNLGKYYRKGSETRGVIAVGSYLNLSSDKRIFDKKVIRAIEDYILKALAYGSVTKVTEDAEDVTVNSDASNAYAALKAAKG